MRNIGVFFKKVKVISWIFLGLWIFFGFISANGGTDVSSYPITFSVCGVIFLLPVFFIEFFTNPVSKDIRKNRRELKAQYKDEATRNISEVREDTQNIIEDSEIGPSVTTDVVDEYKFKDENNAYVEIDGIKHKSRIDKVDRRKKYRPSTRKVIASHIINGVFILFFALLLLALSIIAIIIKDTWFYLFMAIPCIVVTILCILSITGVFSRATFDKWRKNIFLTDAQLYELEYDRKINKISVPIFLNKDEVAVYYCNAQLRKSKMRVVGHSGATGGVSVRLGKGVYYNVGRSAGKPVYGKVATFYPGQLIITNKRIVFLNNEKGFEVINRKLTAVKWDNTGVTLQSSSRVYELIMVYSELAKIAFECVTEDMKY